MAVIGTGASAFQIVPTVAPVTEHLTVFQRSAPWMFPNPNYHAAVGPGVAWAVRHLPYYGRWYRFLLFWPACDGGLAAMRVDPDYPHPDVAISEINDAARQVFTQWMADQIGDDAELLAKVVPDYVCLGKRTLQDNGSWLGALTRDDVELVTDPIERIVADGVVTRGPDGTERHHPVDVIVYATGFEANKFLWPMTIVGRDGRVLGDQWGDQPTAHLGITVPHFPNLFCLYGPGTNLASGGSIIFHVECQVRYVMGALVALDGRRSRGHGGPPGRPRRLQRRACRPSWTRWCGRTRPFATAGTAGPMAASTACRPGDWWTTGPGPRHPTWPSSSSPDPHPQIGHLCLRIPHISCPVPGGHGSGRGHGAEGVVDDVQPGAVGLAADDLGGAAADRFAGEVHV